MLNNRRCIALAALTFLGAALGCGGDSAPAPTGTGPQNPIVTPISGVTATVVSQTSIRVAFTSRVGDNSYTIERAEGASGSFAGVTVLTAPGSAMSVTFTDLSLKPNTLYRYRVIAVVGSTSASPSSEASATTLIGGASVADITTDITVSRTLFAETTYTIKGFVHVANGATLTIRPGTVIKGDYNTLGSSLFILRGAKINAVGTADAPIVFTSSRPTGSRQPGDWGGLVIVGNGLDNRSGSVVVEGSGTDGATVTGGKNYQVVYTGGTTPSDNSGTLSYVRVEFAGYSPSADVGLDAFTFAAVGSNTRVSYLQSMAALNDAYSFAGGALDGDHLVAYETGDDMFDMTEGFSGRLQYLIGFNSRPITGRSGAGFASTDAEGIESDGCNGSGCDSGFNQQPYTTPLVTNFTLVGCGEACATANGSIGLLLRRGSGGYYANGVVSRFPTAGVSMRDLETFTRTGLTSRPDVSLADLQLRNIYFTESIPLVFQQSPANQYSIELAINNLTNGASIAQSLFTALPTPGTAPASLAELDWTPQASAPIVSGGMSTLLGRYLTKGQGFITGTSYLGAAAPGGPKWWAGWTIYARD